MKQILHSILFHQKHICINLQMLLICCINLHQDYHQVCYLGYLEFYQNLRIFFWHLCIYSRYHKYILWCNHNHFFENLREGNFHIQIHLTQYDQNKKHILIRNVHFYKYKLYYYNQEWMYLSDK